MIGGRAGYSNIITGSNNTFLGYNTNATVDTNYSTAIGYNAQVTGNNQIVLGTTSETVYCPNKLGVGTQSPAYSLDILGGNASTFTGLNVKSNGNTAVTKFIV